VERPTEQRVADLVPDHAAHQAWRGDVPLVLSTKQFALLEPFLRHPGQVLVADPDPRTRVGLRL
jgi:two-component system OmpR family response regulator